MANGTVYMREHLPVDSTIVSRALVELPDHHGLIAVLDDGRAWPFRIEMAQKIIDVFAPHQMPTMDLNGLLACDQARLFESALRCALETELSMTHIVSSANLDSGRRHPIE